MKAPINGKVYLVGAGPGDPNLLTVKAHALIRAAQVILHDDLISAPILALANPHPWASKAGSGSAPKTFLPAISTPAPILPPPTPTPWSSMSASVAAQKTSPSPKSTAS